MLHRPIIATLASLVLIAACSDEPSPSDPEPEPTLASPKANVKLKSNDRLRADFARTLGLSTGKVCSELGRYSCTHKVHRVPLQGTAAYDLGLYEPLPDTTLTAPIAVDRIALAACGRRVDRDSTGAEPPLIWKRLPIDGQGGLADVAAPEVVDAIVLLYQRAIQRLPTDQEIAEHQELYRDIAQAGSAAPARDWAVLSCFIVMTSVEQLYY